MQDIVAELTRPELLIVSALIGWVAPRFWQILAAPVLLGVVEFIFGDPAQSMRDAVLRIAPASILVAAIVFSLRRLLAKRHGR